MLSSVWTSTMPVKKNQESSTAGRRPPPVRIALKYPQKRNISITTYLCCLCRFHNKGVYLKAGLQKLSHTRNLHKDLKLQVDKQDIELPSIEGLIFLNIPR